MATLDLARDDASRVAGRQVTLGGATYELLDAREPLDAPDRYYPLLNSRSGLVRLVAKVYKHPKTAPDHAEQMSQLAVKGFMLNAKGIRCAHSDVFEVAGGLLRTMPLTWHIATKRSCDADMERADALIRKDPAKALAIYDQVLEKNPDHTVAIMNRTACYGQLGRTNDALDPLLHAIDVEPNDPDIPRQLAITLLNLGNVPAALAVLAERLQRSPWDYDNFLFFVECSLEHDRAAPAERALARVRPLVAEAEWLPETVKKLEDSKSRRAERDELLARAFELQKKGAWAEARALNKKAFGFTRDTDFCVINARVCDYHLTEGSGPAVATELHGLASDAYRLMITLPVPSSYSAAILSVLAAARAGKLGLATAAARWLGSAQLTPWDLPTVPTAVSEGAVIEQRDTGEIPRVLASLEKGHPEIEDLIARYAARRDAAKK